MQFLRILVQVLILITSVPTFLFPHDQVPRTSLHVHKKEAKKKKQDALLSYDDILLFLKRIESGELEDKCTEKQLKRINRFLAHLAKEGEIPSDERGNRKLHKDIKELLEEEPEFTLWTITDNEYELMFAFADTQEETLLCKNWLKKNWKKTKKFVKKHKKQIIVGAVIVVAVTVVVVAAVAATSATAVAAGGAAGAAATSKNDKEKTPIKQEPSPIASSTPAAKEKSRPKHESSSIVSSASTSKNDKEEKYFPLQEPSFFPSADTTNDTDEKTSPLHEPFPVVSPMEIPSSTSLEEIPILKEMFDQEITTFKESVAEDIILTPEVKDRDPTFGEKAREFGSTITHEILSGISELGSFVPELCEELKEITSKIPLLSPPDLESVTPMENYEKIVADAHSVIDYVFSTDLAKNYTPEAKAHDPMNRFTMGYIPLPGEALSEGFNASKFKKVLQSGKECAVLTEELGFNGRQVTQVLEETPLNAKIAKTFEATFPKTFTGAIEIQENGIWKIDGKVISLTELMNDTKIAEVTQLEKQISDWLGNNVKFIRNNAGDPVFLSEDGLRRVRFDFNHLHPHNNPHAHVEFKVNDEWIKPGPIYPIDVPHN